jgi:hypothetical protein
MTFIATHIFASDYLFADGLQQQTKVSSQASK